jgi:predicted dehydrogenase
MAECRLKTLQLFVSSIWTEKTMSDPENLSFLVIGLGSIGKRHVRNLHALGIKDITVVRREPIVPEEPDLPAFSIQTDLNAALQRKPDGVIIASPTSLHLEHSIAAARAGCHILVEKPISHSLDGIETLRKLVEQNQLFFQSAFQFRFHPVFRQIKAILDQGVIGAIISAHVHWGEYLPAWHPWEDYRHGYSARQDLGGGVVLTLCHPFDYLRWLIGEINSLSAIVAKLSNLEIDVEDTAMITFRFESGAVGSVYLDYVERPSQHRLEIIGQSGKITWDNSTGIANVFSEEHRKQQLLEPPDRFERNVMFLDELEHFIDCLKFHREPNCSLQDGVRALEIADAIKLSSLQRKEVILS